MVIYSFLGCTSTDYYVYRYHMLTLLPQNRADTVAMISLHHVFDNLLLDFDGQAIASWGGFLSVEFVVNFQVIILQLGCLYALGIKLQAFQLKRAYLKGQKRYILLKDLIKYLILLCKVYNFFPVPLRIDKITIVHIGSERFLNNAIEAHRPAIKGSQQLRVNSCEQANIQRLFIMHILQSKYNSGVIERTNTKLKILNIANCVPLVSGIQINVCGLNFGTGTNEVPLNKQRLIVSPLYCSLVVILIADCYCMRIFLVFAAVGTFIHPLPVVLAQPIEIYPKCALPVTNHTLRALQIHRDFVGGILDVGEGSCRVGVPVQLIVFLKVGLVVLVLEEFSFHGEPAVRVSHKFMLVLDRGSHLEIQVLQVIALRR